MYRCLYFLGQLRNVLSAEYVSTNLSLLAVLSDVGERVRFTVNFRVWNKEFAVYDCYLRLFAQEVGRVIDNETVVALGTALLGEHGLRDRSVTRIDSNWPTNSKPSSSHSTSELRNQLGIGDTADGNTFRLDGENYQIRFNSKRFSLSNSVGLWYLREFLTHPTTLLDPVDLESARTGVSARSSNSSTGESFDAEARRQYARQLAEIDEEIAEAASFNDIGRSEQLQNDRQRILDHVAKATRKGGKARVATDASKARKNIRQQVNREVDRIRTFCPELAEHLRIGFQGDPMCYQPDYDPHWQF